MANGRLYDGLKAIGLSGKTILRHRYLIPACAVVLVAAGLWCARRCEIGPLNATLNAASIAAIAFPLIAIGSSRLAEQGGCGSAQLECTLQPPPGHPLPDVYQIILESLARDGVLREVHGQDNSPSLDSLGLMGFQVALGSISNYRPSAVSVSSMLNMAYLQEFPELFGVDPRDRWDVLRILRHNRARHARRVRAYLG